MRRSIYFFHLLLLCSEVGRAGVDAVVVYVPGVVPMGDQLAGAGDN